MTKVHVYLNFEGTTEKAFNFYKSVFGGEFFMMQRYKEMQGAPNMSAADGEKILHVGLPLTEETQLHGSDLIPGVGSMIPLKIGNNISIMLSPDSRQEADRLFGKLSVDGKQVMPLADMFWGDYFGSFTDQFGVEWMIDYSPAPQM